jgi:hypothetical protein
LKYLQKQATPPKKKTDKSQIIVVKEGCRERLTPLKRNNGKQQETITIVPPHCKTFISMLTNFQISRYYGDFATLGFQKSASSYPTLNENQRAATK